MKKCLLLFASVLFFSCSAYVPVNVSPQSSSKEYELETSKDDLYVQVNNWMIDSFENAKSVIDFSDKEAGIITGKYLIGEVYSASNNYGLTDVYATVRVQIKDDYAKLTVTPENYQYIDSGDVSEDHKLPVEKVNRQVNTLLESFEQYVAKN
ncbi:DUF4468 domain-containing protein [Autumnicola edwardsiae]|uniref:DUF4468 domain-containing protein n=1 Tax=Autumnicola edwardsiae TaxID=3075594 RepID=A0ABU3CTQ9_9FLAO|nr:DUF4468 domain-containing protein [Zunongwangia sp. F297]MDT0649748.1 DUF4468 domain-containing protein [Zunongwangia sp. F297]